MGYHTRFPKITPEEAAEGIFTGDGSPTYFQAEVHKQISKLTPNTRIILGLREPLARSYSKYNFFAGLEMYPDVPTQNDLNRFEDEFYSEWEDLSTFVVACARKDYALNAYGIFLRGWHAEFTPEQVMVVFAEEFSEDPQRIMEEVADFVGLRPIEWVPLVTETQWNVGHYQGQDNTLIYVVPNTNNTARYEHNPLNPDLLEEFRSMWGPFNCDLQEYLNRTLPETWFNEGTNCEDHHYHS